MKLSSAICKLHQLDRPMKDFKKFSNSKLLSADFENEEQDSHTSALDKLPIFASFLTQVFLIQVLLYGCIFFIILYPEKDIWPLVLYEMHIFNVAPSAVDSGSVLNILTNNISGNSTACISRINL